MTLDSSEIIHALSALAQESRLNIFRLLVQRGPEGLAATKIGEALKVAPTSMSFHLKELLHARLVTARHEGRFVIYSANFDTMNGLIGFLTENCCGGNVCAPDLCRPSESVLEILEHTQVGPVRKEDGDILIDAEGRRVEPAA